MKLLRFTTFSEVPQAIKEALELENIEMPTEIYTLIFRNNLLAETGVKNQVEVKL